jgi:hypothetical protein
MEFIEKHNKHIQKHSENSNNNTQKPHGQEKLLFVLISEWSLQCLQRWTATESSTLLLSSPLLSSTNSLSL